MNLYLESLGCDKNRVDSEKLLSELLDRYAGSRVVDDPQDADIAIVNTCSFIGPAKEESIQSILDLAEYKKTGRLQMKFEKNFPKSMRLCLYGIMCAAWIKR